MCILFLVDGVCKFLPVLGHEIAGRIVSFGSGNKRIDYSGDHLEVGDFVT